MILDTKKVQKEIIEKMKVNKNRIYRNGEKVNG